MVNKLFLLSIILAVSIHAQEDQKGGGQVLLIGIDTNRNNFSSISFDKSFNTYHWRGLAAYQYMYRSMFLQMNEQFLSTLVKTDRKHITDNQSLDLRLRYGLTDNISAASNISSFLLSDNRDIGGSITKASFHVIHGGISLRLFKMFLLEPLLGFRSDTQLAQKDDGISYLLGVTSDKINYQGYNVKLDGSLQYDNIDPRRMEAHNALLRIQKSFFEQSSNSFSLNYSRNRRDFYQLADSAIQRQHKISNNIETRIDNTLGITDSLRYKVGEKFLWIFRANISMREIDKSIRYKNLLEPDKSTFHTNVSELKIEGSLFADYKFNDRLKSSFAFSYIERDEEHRLLMNESIPSDRSYQLKRMEDEKNNHALRTSFLTMTTWAISKKDTMEFTGSANILRYDTPSIDNYDDRDELWYRFSLSLYHQINRNLELRIGADLHLKHLVYLFAARSSDNNWNRLIRLAPQIRYTPTGSFRTTNIFEVLANYTVYDYEYLLSQPRSFVFRQFAFVDSSLLQLTDRLDFEWFSHIKLYERGEFHWGSFSERLINYFEDKTFSGKFNFLLRKGLLFSVGIRYFNQMRFSYLLKNRELESLHSRIGPTAAIEFNNESIEFMFSGWYEYQEQTKQTARNVSTMFFTFKVHI